MASMVREFARSAVHQLRQPRWNRLLLKSNINLHLPAIHQQRRFSQCPDEGSEDQKFCIDYKKNPTIEGHQPPDLPKLKPADQKLKIARRREFLKKKKCEELGKQGEKERKEAEESDPCANFSRASLVWGKPKVHTSLVWHKINTCLAKLSKLRTLDPDPVYLNQERNFSRKVEQELGFSLAPVSASSKPIPCRSKQNSLKRMAIKRRYFQEKKKKEAIAMLKHASSSNSQTKTDLKIIQSNIEQEDKKEADTAKPQRLSSTEEVELKQLLKKIKERCQKKCEEFKKSREAESKREAEEAALRNQAKMSQIRKICTEAKKLNSVKMAKLKCICEEAHLRQQSIAAKLGNHSEEVKLRNRFEEPKARDQSKKVILSFEKEYSKDD